MNFLQTRETEFLYFGDVVPMSCVTAAAAAALSSALF